MITKPQSKRKRKEIPCKLKQKESCGGYTNVRKKHTQDKIILREKGHHITIKMSIYREDVTIINIYKPNHRAPIYMKHKLTELKGRNRRFNIKG